MANGFCRSAALCKVSLSESDRAGGVIIRCILLSLLLVAPAHAKWMKTSYYSQGVHTSSGERFNAAGFTAAHRTFPFGTELIVCHAGRCVACRVNDRGPFLRGRELDISLGAAKRIGLIHRGVARVQVKFPMPKPKPASLAAIAAE